MPSRLDPRARVARAVRSGIGSLYASVLLGLLLVSLSPAGATPGGRSAEALTHALEALAARPADDDPGVAAARLEELVAAAEERRAALAGLVETDPGAVLESALSSERLAGLPPGIQAKLEREVELEGELEVVVEDGESWSRTRHVLKDASGKRRSLHFAEQPPELLTGDRVRVRGVEVPTDGGEESSAVVAYCCSSDGGVAGVEVLAAAGVPNTFGEQRTLVLLVNFPARLTEPWTVEQAREFVFGAPSDFFYENSYGQTWLAGDVYGWFTIPVDISMCQASTIAVEADRAARAAGIDVSAYDRLVYAYPDTGCPGSGEASVGGVPSWAWLDGSLDRFQVTTHELGHNMGLQHSHALDCIDTVLAPVTECNRIEYGDFFDVMGSGIMHFNAFQKERLGWLGLAASPPITTVASSGTYEIGPYAPAGTSPKALRILRSVDATTGLRTFYYIEHRRAVGFDSMLADLAEYTNNESGVLIHLGTEGDAYSSFHLDMTPASQRYDWDDPALHTGESYVDPESGIAITTVAVDGSGASVTVSLSGPSSCFSSAPGVSLSPAASATVAPGTSVSYTATVTNRDGTGCAASRFDLTAIVPSGWSATPGTAALQIGPGASSTTTLRVVSPTTATEGSYAIKLRARDGLLAGHEGTASASYLVGSAAGNSAPVAVDDRGQTSNDAAVDVAVLLNDSDPDGDFLRVDGASQGAKGSVRVNADSTVTYTPRPGARGDDTFTYSVTDGRLGSSASVAIKLGQGKGRRK